MSDEEFLGRLDYPYATSADALENEMKRRAAITDLPSGKEFWESARKELGYDEQLQKIPALEAPAYFVSFDPYHGDTMTYGPYDLAQEARNAFQQTYPAFDGGSVTLIKIAPAIPGITASRLRTAALREEWERKPGHPEETRWREIYSQSTTVMARDVWDVSQDQAGLIYRHKGKEYAPEFLAEIEKETKSDRSYQNAIESIYESEWYQGFGSECKEHLGRGKDGYYYGLEIGESDLSWQGPCGTREEAEERLGEAFVRWDDRTGAREQAWEDRQIAQFEKENRHGDPEQERYERAVNGGNTDREYLDDLADPAELHACMQEQAPEWEFER